MKLWSTWIINKILTVNMPNGVSSYKLFHLFSSIRQVFKIKWLMFWEDEIPYFLLCIWRSGLLKFWRIYTKKTLTLLRYGKSAQRVLIIISCCKMVIYSMETIYKFHNALWEMPLSLKLMVVDLMVTLEETKHLLFSKKNSIDQRWSEMSCDM